MSIGIVGCGFVGSAVKLAYDLIGTEVLVHDPAIGYNNTYEELLSAEVIFVCVPSPQREDGSCDTSILENVLTKLNDLGYTNPIISKVTAPPLVYRKLHEQYPNLVYAPEFLIAKNAKQDYIASEFLIVGGDVIPASKALVSILPTLKFVKHTRLVTIEEASLIKYTINCFLATKVSFMNQVYEYCQANDIFYNRIADGVALDKRLGDTHLQVPGPDGKFGFGGACFPKDTSAMISFGDQFSVLEEVVNYNNRIRNG